MQEKNKEQLHKGRKAKLFIIPTDDIIRALNLPEDAHVVGVEYKAEYLGFFVAVAHESFDPVDKYTQLPKEPYKRLKKIK